MHIVGPVQFTFPKWSSVKWALELQLFNYWTKLLNTWNHSTFVQHIFTKDMQKMWHNLERQGMGVGRVEK